MVHVQQIFINLCGYRVNKPCLEAAAMGTSKLLGVTALSLALSLCVNVYERVCVC